VKEFRIQGITGDSTIRVGEPLGRVKKYIPVEKAVVITDTNVRRLYEKDFPHCEIIEIGTGEEIKTLDTVRSLYRRLLEKEADRSTFIVGIGGGIVCDIAGFVASTYLRGVRFGFVPTTLLSQIDAGVGGKNGVNFLGYKNMVGTYRQPEFVLCDPELLQTLPEPEILCGMAEIVKHAAIGDLELFLYLEGNCKQALKTDSRVIERLVHDSLRVKSLIVNCDETEKGERRKLNFGHTFGHAIEKITGIRHGEAVSIGMYISSLLSVNMGFLSLEEAGRIEQLLRGIQLPTRVPLEGTTIVDAVRKDKKREGDEINFVLLRGIGNASIERIPIRTLKSFFNQVEVNS